MNPHEESECQAPPAGPILCIRNCGFFGTAATMNMCSKCHKEYSVMKQEQQPKLVASTIGSTVVDRKRKEPITSSDLDVQAVSKDPKTIFQDSIFAFASQYDASADTKASSYTFGAGQNNDEAKQPGGKKRCTSCNKRVGLTGFNCRCGHHFCGVHRYPEKHDCSYDYRTTGRDAVAKANPVVKAQKIDKF